MSDTKYHVFGRNHGKKLLSKLGGYEYSYKKLEKLKPEQGQLYFCYFNFSNHSPFIGEEEKGILYDGVGRTSHDNYLMEVDYSDILIYIISSDGKQKHSDLVDENIGEVFPLEQIGSHDKYKYQILIDDELVSLSRDNVLFYTKNMIGSLENPDGFFQYMGIPGRLSSRVYDYLGQIKYRAFHTLKEGYTLYVPEGLLDPLTDINVVGFTRVQENELREEGLIGDNHDEERFSDILIKRGMFGEQFNTYSKGYDGYLNSYIIDDSTLEKIKELFKGRYRYKNNCFVLIKKHYNVIFDETKERNSNSNTFREARVRSRNRGNPRFNTNSINDAVEELS